ncbi:MAG TPA: 23S rRNA (guanosine(2251)-2'-O)-methyltransferase RlmB [Thermomicrobiales bacterium]|nr:23S rRNA (guanosine(2251)-2'-O)-methyltransferase RlmB [Thermomicrobiales bacterium]
MSDGQYGKRQTSQSGPGRDERKGKTGVSAPSRGARPLRPAGKPGPGQQKQGSGQAGGKQRRGQQTPFTIKGELLFGRNAVLESLRAGRRTATRLWVAEGMRQDPRVDDIIQLARTSEVLLDTVPRSMLDDQLPDVNHQGVLLETPAYPYADLADVIEAEGDVLVLDHLQDPQNVGTLLRAADAAGVAGVVIPSDRSASILPTVVNASSGAVEHILIAGVPNIGNAIDKLEASGRWVVGLDDGSGSQDLFQTDLPTPVALVVGAEGSGISPGIRKRCQLIVSIPMAGQVESLNAATAGSIALFDLVRRRSS